MVTNHLRAPYGVYFTKNRTILRRPYGPRPAAGRIVRFFIIFLDIVRCPVKFRYYLKFHGARPAFSYIGRAPDDFYLIFISYDSNGARPGTVRCPAGHRTMSDKRQEVSNQKSLNKSADARPGTGRCPSGHRPMFYESNCHR